MAPLPGWFVVLSSLGLWLLLSLLVGLLVNRVPQAWLMRQSAPLPTTQRRAALRSVLAPPGIRVWKRWIPDAGPVLPGGIAKATLVRRDPQSLRRLVAETRRAELVHWLLWPAGLFTALWLPPAAVAVNLVFATAFNLPCLLLQRYNRSRLQRCLARAQSSR